MSEVQRTTILKVRADKGWQWNERVRAKKCDTVDWDQIMIYSLKRRQTRESQENELWI